MATKSRVGRPDVRHTTTAVDAIVALARYIKSTGKKLTASRVCMGVYGMSANKYDQDYVRRVLSDHGIEFNYRPQGVPVVHPVPTCSPSAPDLCTNFVVTTTHS